MRVKKIILDKEKHHVKQNTLILCIQNLNCLKCCTNIWNSAYPRMHRTVHFQTSPLLDFPSSVKFTTIFQSPEAKTSECHLIFFFQIQNLTNSTYIFLCLLCHTFPLSPFCFRLVWKSLNWLLHNSHLLLLYLILYDVTKLPKLDRQSYHFSPQNS